MKAERKHQNELIPAMKRIADKITEVHSELDHLCKNKEIIVKDGEITVRFKNENH